MLKVRERTNTWPGFVDLFSNLVILLVFLLIVFVFLWAATNVFGTRGTVGDLSRENAAQTEIIEQMSADEEEARRLLYMARDELDLMTGEMEQLSVDNAALLTEIDAADATLVSNAKTTEQIIATYEEKINNLTAAIESVTAQLE
ncbi:MAG: hypothetical protein LBR41_02055, partial [Rickettsiales bacterium]|nr:hypothetical protein [Rickettsiales bacterium]